MSPMLLKPLYESLFNKPRDDFQMNLSGTHKDVLRLIFIRCPIYELMQCREVRLFCKYGINGNEISRFAPNGRL